MARTGVGLPRLVVEGIPVGDVEGLTWGWVHPAATAGGGLARYLPHPIVSEGVRLRTTNDTGGTKSAMRDTDGTPTLTIGVGVTGILMPTGRLDSGNVTSTTGPHREGTSGRGP